jgi:hypothetical protein
MPSNAAGGADDLAKFAVLIALRRPFLNSFFSRDGVPDYPEKRPDFFDIRLTGGQAGFTDMDFFNLANDINVAAQIQGVDYFALEIDGTLINERGGLQLSVKHVETAVSGFVRPGPRINATVIGLFHLVDRRNVDREGTILADSL